MPRAASNRLPLALAARRPTTLPAGQASPAGQARQARATGTLAAASLADPKCMSTKHNVPPTPKLKTSHLTAAGWPAG